MADQDRLAGRSTLDDTVKLDNSTSPRAGDAVPAETVDWLLAGDPAIRWQTMRDLLDSPPAEVENERARVAVAGWGRRLLERQDPEGTWAQGLYSPKWTSTTYTLLLLMRCGLQTGSPSGATWDRTALGWGPLLRRRPHRRHLHRRPRGLHHLHVHRPGPLLWLRRSKS